jgi:hypothetical protein
VDWTCGTHGEGRGVYRILDEVLRERNTGKTQA